VDLQYCFVFFVFFVFFKAIWPVRPSPKPMALETVKRQKRQNSTANPHTRLKKRQKRQNSTANEQLSILCLLKSIYFKQNHTCTKEFQRFSLDVAGTGSLPV